MKMHNNDNVNFSLKNNNVNNVNVKEKTVDLLANDIARKMGNSDNSIAMKLYMKAGWHLPQNTIWNCVELAKNKGRNPASYLSWLLKKELNEINK